MGCVRHYLGHWCKGGKFPDGVDHMYLYWIPFGNKDWIHFKQLRWGESVMYGSVGQHFYVKSRRSVIPTACLQIPVVDGELDFANAVVLFQGRNMI